MHSEDIHMKNNDEKVGVLLKKFKDKTKDISTSVTEKISDAAQAGQDKLEESMGDIDGITSAIRELGYSLNGISIGVGLIPDIQFELSGLTKTMDDGTFERIMEEQKEKKIVCAALKALQTASTLQNRIHIMGMRSDVAAITLGIPPKVTLKFKKNGDQPEKVNPDSLPEKNLNGEDFRSC
jgi:hypothetical protein